MESPSASLRTVRFGVFEFDPRAGELRKQGVKIKLQGQPIEILGLLLERPGEVITREELQKQLWPADTFVDFDHSLNAAMKRLRDALDDSAGTPRYIETSSPRLPLHRPAGWPCSGGRSITKPPPDWAGSRRHTGAVGGTCRAKRRRLARPHFQGRHKANQLDCSTATRKSFGRP